MIEFQYPYVLISILLLCLIFLWHNYVGTKTEAVMRFSDLKLIPSKSIIQVRSASRVGLGDLGVNQKRVDYLYIPNSCLSIS